MKNVMHVCNDDAGVQDTLRTCSKSKTRNTIIVFDCLYFYTIFVNRQEHVQAIRIKIKACINLLS